MHVPCGVYVYEVRWLLTHTMRKHKQANSITQERNRYIRNARRITARVYSGHQFVVCCVALCGTCFRVSVSAPRRAAPASAAVMLRQCCALCCARACTGIREWMGWWCCDGMEWAQLVRTLFFAYHKSNLNKSQQPIRTSSNQIHASGCWCSLPMV